VIQTISFCSPFAAKERLSPADAMAVAHKRAALEEPRYRWRRRTGNSASRIWLLHFRGNASKINSRAKR
jgi:hypothetical protein